MTRTQALWLLVLIPVDAALLAQDGAGGQAPGGAPAGTRYRMVQAPPGETETPDIIILRDGRRITAHFLQTQGSSFVYYAKEGQSWVKEEVARSRVATIQVAGGPEPPAPGTPPAIEPAAKQPTPRDDLLSGVFAAAKGRSARFKLAFTSEIDKLIDEVEDATDFGVVEIETSVASGAGRDARSHEVSGSGRYALYAPGRVNNRDWVLVLTEVVLREVDRGLDTSLFTSVAPDEIFILRFGAGKDSFQLEWSNVGNHTWGTLTSMTFRRAADAREEPRCPERRPDVTPARSFEPTVVLARRTEAQATPAAPASRSRIEGWKPPTRRWP
jgi:hypothetical protein